MELVLLSVTNFPQYPEDVVVPVGNLEVDGLVAVEDYPTLVETAKSYIKQLNEFYNSDVKFHSLTVKVDDTDVVITE